MLHTTIGPLLFAIYINDLPKSCKTFKYVMYADDTTLFTTIQSLNSCTKDIEQHLNTELNKVNEWLKINKLSLNISGIQWQKCDVGHKWERMLGER